MQAYQQQHRPIEAHLSDNFSPFLLKNEKILIKLFVLMPLQYKCLDNST